MKTVTIARDEYETLIKKAMKTEIDQDFIDSMTKSFEDIKHGRVSLWKPRTK